MAAPEAGLFKKQVVTRQFATSILTSLLSSPKTTCSSPDLSSPCDIFSECDLTSRSESASTPARTQSRKSCLSFAAAPPKSPPANMQSIATRSKIKFRSETTTPLVVNPIPLKDDIVHIESVSNIHVRLGLSSIFDDYDEENSNLVFHDYYRIGQPKKLVDDCLKKEKELCISPIQDDEDKDEADGKYFTSDGEDENESISSDEGNNEEVESECDDDDGDSNIKAPAVKSTVHSQLKINSPMANNILSSSAINTPSRDVVDNFVPGTLDEDQSELFGKVESPQLPHDIDPTYPSEDDEDGDQQFQPTPAIASPVRFLSKYKTLVSRHPISTVRSNGLNRTHSLPWGRKRNNGQLKQPAVKSVYLDAPKCAAIAIVKSVEHKRHNRRERKDADHCDEEKGIGVEAMAAMAKRLTTKNNLGLWAVSV